ncbi:MAG: cryptochrome/photolyase family protein [Haloarculaceae archaeon]
MTVLVLGDQLSRRHGPLADRPDDPVLLIESAAFAERLPYHPHKLTLVFSAMRHVRDQLREQGRPVHYVQSETFEDGFEQYAADHPEATLHCLRPSSYGSDDRLHQAATVAGLDIEFVDNDLFLCDAETFDEWASDRDGYRHEDFYRFMRRKTGYLMVDDDPVGGEWNYDDQNRETPPEGWDAPSVPAFEPDETTREVQRWVRERFDGGYDDPPYGGSWADPEEFRWPVTRQQALRALDDFVSNRLPVFGEYQDAMLADEWALAHSLLSTSLNLGLLHPAEVIERAVGAYHDGNAPLNCVEGFVRQVLGWREFLRHVYRREMPTLATANALEATEDLPEFYWTGETEMACLSDVVDGVRRRGYSHHIERLMLLSNFGLLYGVEPARLNRWFHAGYVDAFHWVTTPNVVEMGLYGANLFATKPYAASANYVDKMSDYCGECPYYKTKTTGEGACPFNTLYWDFLDRNEERLRSNHRMGLVYNHLDNKSEEELAAIREQAVDVRERARRSEL